MENNSAASKAKNGIHIETGHYVMGTGDTCLMWIQEFDENGRLLRYTDHFQCGKKYIDYEYRYHEDGRLRKAWISHHSNNFQRIEMAMKEDDNGQVIELAPGVEIKDYPFAERYEYDMVGRVSKTVRMKKDLFSFNVDSEKLWDPETSYTLKSKQEVYDEDGTLKWILLREFERY